MTKSLVDEVRDQFKGVFPKNDLPKDALLFIPLSPMYYKTEMKEGAPQKLLSALETVQTSDMSASEKKETIEVIMDQLKKMALFDPLREHLIDADAITTVASIVAKCPISEAAAGHIASFLSNMTIFTFKHHPGSAKHMRRIEPYADAILDSLVKIQYAHGHVPTIMYATAYSLENFTAHDFSCAHLLKPELPRSKELIDFLIKNARGETEAQNSPISKKCIDALERLVHHALDASAPVSGTLLPGTDAKTADRILDTLFKWHLEYYPWSWAHKQAIQQMVPHQLQEYTEAHNACTTTLQKWSMHSAFGGPEGEIDATGRTPNRRPPLWDAMVTVANSMADIPPSQCYVEITQKNLNVAMFSVAPTPEIAYEYMANVKPADEK